MCTKSFPFTLVYLNEASISKFLFFYIFTNGNLSFLDHITVNRNKKSIKKKVRFLFNFN